MTKSKTLPPWVINFFFFLGLLSAFLFRALIFFNHYAPKWSRPAWYVGVVGYLLFFGYRYYISHKRRVSITQNRLMEKVRASDLASDDKDEIVYLFQSILKSKEMFNYIFIFSVSLVAIVMDILLMFLD